MQKSTGKLYWYGMGSDPLTETDAAGSITDEYIFFGGKRIARRHVNATPPDTITYYFADHLGSSRVVTDAAGTVLDDSDFYPFGGERPVVGPASGNNYKFTGKERDSESGLDNFGARYNSSNLGRFMSVDPSRTSIDRSNPQSWNRYTYALNNPLAYVDRNGLWPTWVHNDIYRAVFSGVLTGHQISVLEKGSRDVDFKNGGQRPENSNRHSMCVPGQSVGACAAGIMGNINSSINATRQQLSASNGKLTDDAIRALARAEHALTDMGSPQHVAADGTPITWTGAFWPGVSHFFGEESESVDWARVGQSVRLAIAGYLEACKDQDCPTSGADPEAWAQRAITSIVSATFAFPRGSDPEGFLRESREVAEDRARQCALGNRAACND